MDAEDLKRWADDVEAELRRLVDATSDFEQTSSTDELAGTPGYAMGPASRATLATGPETSAANQPGQAAGAALLQLQAFLEALPPGYQESTDPAEAARDLVEMSRLGPGQDARFVVSEGRLSAQAGVARTFRLRRIAAGRVELSALVTVLESFGLSVLEAVPWRFLRVTPDGPPVFVDDIAVRVASDVAHFDVLETQGRLVGAIQAVLAGAAEQSKLNELVLSAGLGWREVNLLSAYREYRQVAGGPRAAERAEAMLESLVAYPSVARAAVDLFAAWFCPGEVPAQATPAGDGSSAQATPARDGTDALTGAGAARAARAALGALGGPEAGVDRLNSALAGVPDLAHYEALKELATLLLATTRSNWALERETVAFKLRSGDVPFLPNPRPFAEVFVWSPRFLGIHLRFGPVARGGVRWSERQSDLRAEILELARAQVKKNSLIVPTGAKGGFVLRHGPSGGAGQAAVPDRDGSAGRTGMHSGANGVADEVAARNAYRSFVGALLDLTDNIVGGVVRSPAGVVCRDGPDPYLVVAPDKGTAGFSDLANEVSAERSYWLGDAFASGGSHGYDHKALGITAKGAWLAVRRHFRALGLDAQRDPFRAVGVGDMSGDVFGNCMLQSHAINLVAAFDHRHIFVDPEPLPGRAFEERRRLYNLEHSSWADYDLAAASRGAAVYSRQEKLVELPEEAAKALAIGGGWQPGGAGTRPDDAAGSGAPVVGTPQRAGPTTIQLTPPELVRAVLSAPVDLVYFGGVGTFVKAPRERDVEVDDEANDDVRVTSDRLRARVVVEGANLAMTQSARSGYARRGGRVNTDFVDNAAGVAMSDREVNIKVLLGLALERASPLPAVFGTKATDALAGHASELALASVGADLDRDRALAAAKAGAAEAVLADVEQNIVALDRATSTSGDDLDIWEAAISDFEAGGLLDREVESLPNAEMISRRREAGAGLTRPELAVLLAYARSELARSIEASPLVTDTSLLALAVGYFPPPLGPELADLVPRHPLFQQIVSSQLANEVIARMGGLWAHEVSSEYCAPPWLAAAAYWAAREALGLPAVYGEIDDLAHSVPLDVELELRALLAGAAGRLARWYLAGDLRAYGALGRLVERDRALVARLVPGREPEEDPALKALVGQGVARELARLVQAALSGAAAGELGRVASSTGRQFEVTAEAYRLLAEGLGLAQLERLVSGWALAGRWERRQLHSILDDLASLRVSVTASVLGSYPALSPGEAVTEWLAAHRAPLSRALPLVHRLAASERPDLALASAALRAVEVAADRDERL